MKKTFLLLIVTLALNVQSQIISTCAGTGTAAYTGDNGPATAATLNMPSGIAFDNSGNMYIADAGNNVVRMVNTSGIITTFAGTGTASYTGDGGAATSATLSYPTCVAFDNMGNLFIGDGGNHVVRKVNTSGIISTYAGNGTQGNTGDGGQATSAQLFDPISLFYDNSNYSLYVCDDQNQNVRMINISGVISTVAGTGTSGFSGDGGPATSATLSFPTGIMVDPSGNLFIADRANFCIRMVATNGIITTVFGNQSAGCGDGGDGGNASVATFCNPDAIYYSPAGEMYITDMGNENVRVVGTSSLITTFAGWNGIGYASGPKNDGGPAILAYFNNPTQFVMDASNNGYVVDQGNNCIRKICNATDSIAGFVKDPLGSPVYPGTVYLYRTKPSHPGVIDSIGSRALDAAGHYAFYYTVGDHYFVKAVADTNVYPTSVGTYYNPTNPNAYQWDSAHYINSDPCLALGGMDYNINILEIPAGSGPGSISGYVYKLPGYGQRNGPGYSTLGAPLKGVDIKLGKNPGGSPAARTTSDAGGHYTFNNLPLTDYKIYVDIPNYGMDSVLAISLTSGNQTSVNNNYYVDTNKVYVDSLGSVGIKQITAVSGKFVVYPNPTTGKFFIESNSGQKQHVQLIDLNGRVVLTQILTGNGEIDASGLDNGIYYLTIKSNSDSFYRKLVIAR